MRLRQIKKKEKNLLNSYTVLVLRTSNCISTQKSTSVYPLHSPASGRFQCARKKDFKKKKNCQRTDSSKMKGKKKEKDLSGNTLLKTRPRFNLKKMLRWKQTERVNEEEEGRVLETSCVRWANPGLPAAAAAVTSQTLSGWTYRDRSGSSWFSCYCILQR